MKGVVLFLAVAMLALSAVVGYEFSFAYSTRDAVCALRDDVAVRLANGEKILREQHGKLVDIDPGPNKLLVSRSALVTSVAGQRRTLAALRAANCH